MSATSSCWPEITSISFAAGSSPSRLGWTAWCPAGKSRGSGDGSQYSSDDYQRALRDHGIECSTRGKGNCWDDACVESFFGTLQRELHYRRTWPSRRQAAAAIREYIEVFHHRRRPSTFEYASPPGNGLRLVYTAPMGARRRTSCAVAARGSTHWGAQLIGLATLAAIGGCAEAPIEQVVAGLRVRVDPDQARLSILRADGTPLYESLPGGTVSEGRPPHVSFAFRSAHARYEMLYGSFHIEEDAETWRGATTATSIVASSEGVRLRLGGDGVTGTVEVRRLAEGVVRVSLSADQASRASTAFRCHLSEHFIGLGAQTADVDHRGQTVPIWVSEQGIGKEDTDAIPDLWFLRGTRHQSYFPVPFFLSSRGYGLRLDTSRRSLFELCSEDEDVARLEAWEGTLSFVLFDGPSPAEVLRRHSDLEGRAPVPPAFAFAPWNDAIFGSAQIRATARLLRERGIPSSVIWTEDWGGGKSAAGGDTLDYEWQVDRSLYPDVEQLADELHDQGFKFLGYFNSFVEQDADHAAEARAGGYLIQGPGGGDYVFDGVRFQPSSLVDLSNPAAVEWMAGYLRRAIDLGFDGWMADFAEWLPVDAQLAAGEDAEAIHNRYPVLWQRLNERVLTERQDGVERLSFVRSGYTGSQPISNQIVWAGDQNTTFDADDGLPTVIPIGLGLGVAGLPYYGSDIAGFTSPPGVAPTDKELFYRWTTLGALSPVMRTHHGLRAKENWNLASDEETLQHYARWARVHMQLFPYLYQTAVEAAASGLPMMRALALAFPQEEQAWQLKDQFLLGPSLLVAPVVERGVLRRSVFFPEGRWTRIFGGADEHQEGPTTVEVDAPLGEIPVYARQGAVLVLLPEGVQTVVSAAPPSGVTDLGSIGGARELIAVLGASGEARDGAARYVLGSDHLPMGAVSLSWNGAVLSACGLPAIAPCGEVDLQRKVAVARIIGEGELTVADASGATSLSAEGGPPGRTLRVELRW